MAKFFITAGKLFLRWDTATLCRLRAAARALSVIEAGMGFAFLGVVIGYIPVVYASFSRREIQISMLDARAGSPPSAVELLLRLAGRSDDPGVDQKVLDEVLRDWERWAGELLESHISYPVLSFFRSQHSNQSWLGALTTMLDVTSLVLTGIEGVHPGQAKLTFAMARHAAVDLAQVVNARYDPGAAERLPRGRFERLARGACGRRAAAAKRRIWPGQTGKLRSMYEPYVHSIGAQPDADAAAVEALRRRRATTGRRGRGTA